MEFRRFSPRSTHAAAEIVARGDEGLHIGQGQQRPIRIYSYFEQRSPIAAETILRRMDEKFHQLAALPFIGRQRPSLAPGLRSVVVGNHFIFYLVGRDSITVVRVIDGRMDIDEEFRR